MKRYLWDEYLSMKFIKNLLCEEAIPRYLIELQAPWIQPLRSYDENRISEEIIEMKQKYLYLGVRKNFFHEEKVPRIIHMISNFIIIGTLLLISGFYLWWRIIPPIIGEKLIFEWKENEELFGNCSAYYELDSITETDLTPLALPLSSAFKADIHYPWLVRLYMEIGKSSITCGGALISSIHVLTAAHCLLNAEKNNTIIKIGKKCNLNYEQKENFIKVHRYFPHENFKENFFEYDIAILEMEKEFHKECLVQPICYSNKKTDIHSAVHLAGWGRTISTVPSQKILHYHNFRIIHPNYCRVSFSRQASQWNMLCGVAINKNTKSIIKKGSICSGDSGSPLIRRTTDSKWIVAGIGIYSAKKCNTFSGFTDVSSYIDWISNTLDKFKNFQ
ncbi:hypothetical protein SNEBB_010001 [Seison nebaliae]|nr:hypothetical protein SNEBB_010001 [Seison nebaliae]